MYTMTQEKLMELIRSDAPKNVILDTDAYNEVDDQFCIAYCMRSPDKINLLSINAAPFLNNRAATPAEGMEKSYDEIFHIMKLTDPAAALPVYRGSESFLPDRNIPVESDAARNIVDTVMNSEEPVLIVALGAITNVASAILMCPEIVSRTAVIWLGGHALHYSNSREFNMRQDVAGVQVLFDSGITLLQIPCQGVCTEFVTSVPELEYYLRGKNELCDYLVDIVKGECDGKFACSRIIWDVTAAATLIVPKACEMVSLPRPKITAESDYSFDTARPAYVYVRKLRRDAIYGDLFKKLSM